MAFNVKKATEALLHRGIGAAAGGAVGLAANKVLPFSPVIRGIIKIAAGAIVPEFAGKNKFVDYAGAGIAGQAGSELLANFVPSMAPEAPAPVTGIGADAEYITDTDVAGSDVMSGDQVIVEGMGVVTDTMSGVGEADTDSIFE